MKISELIERLGRTVFEAPFGATAQVIGESPEVAEIRIAVLDEVKKKIQRAGGQALFPYNVVRIVIRAAADEGAVFERDFFRRFFDEEVRKGLAKEAAGFRKTCASRFERRRQPLRNRKWLRVEMWRRDCAAGGRKLRARGGRPAGGGRGNRQQIRDSAAKARTNIGRLTDVYKAEGLSRRNDLAFAEDNPINRTVSREHAHIVHDKKTGEYRLFNDRWYKRGNKAENNCGLWIVRDGMGQEVHRDTRGTRLLPGDEIHLGKAVVKFQVK
jgi:hypothetical protein